MKEKYICRLTVRGLVLGVALMLCICGSTFIAYHHRVISSLKNDMSELAIGFKQKHLRMRREMESLKQQSTLHHVTKRNSGNQFPGSESVTTSKGVTYVRWGRPDCKGDSVLVYPGFAGGSYYSHLGGGGNYICIHRNITYPRGKHVDGSQANAYIFGVEWRDGSWTNSIFDYSGIPSGSMQYHSLSCAVCVAPIKSMQIMVPGKDTCPVGWSIEYTGFIMSGRYDDKHSTQYICVDDAPIPVPGTEGTQHGAYIAVVETGCNSFQCQPVIGNRELRCVVCSL